MKIIIIISTIFLLGSCKMEKGCTCDNQTKEIDTVYVQNPIDSSEVAIGYLRSNGVLKED